VIVPSHSTLEDMEALYGIPASRLVVVPLGVDDTFSPQRDSEQAASVRERYVDGRPFLLFVGKLSQRRNIPLLVNAFAEAKRRADLPHALLLFGPNHLGIPLGRIADEAGVGDAVVQVDGTVASHDELASVYNAADLFVSASIYEGFSLPLVEALACGTPCVVAKRAALWEIADGAALLVDEPEDPSAMAAAIERALGDQALRDELSRKGIERAGAFRWTEAARATLQVLREVGSAR
jgi:glycosyltransferase involved in cell wall biosynthesis